VVLREPHAYGYIGVVEIENAIVQAMLVVDVEKERVWRAALASTPWYKRYEPYAVVGALVL